MIVGFSRHGTGGGAGPVDYVTDEKRKGREKEPPAVVRGDPEQTRNLIDSLDFKHKYTSGVLSFAPDEEITPEMENEIIDRFESVAFAGLAPDQYNILWVRHTHAGHHELHFVTPRVELETGKSLNIRPPGDLAKAAFDDFRSEINARYALADPDDPDRARNVATPSHELKAAAEALRSGQKAPDNIRELIDGVLTERALQGQITSREDVLEHVKDLGFEVTREGKNYITVQEPESGQRWRMKGALYEREFEPSRTIEKAERARERDYSRPDEAAARRYAERVNRHIEKRAEYNQERYQKPSQKHQLEHVQEPHTVADRGRVEPLHRHLGRQLGSDALLGEQGHEFEPRNSEHEPEHQDIGSRGGQDSVQPLRRPEAVMRQDRRGRNDLSGRLQDSKGVLDDGTRKAFTDRIRAFGEKLQRAAGDLADRTKRFANDVRAYIAGEQAAESPSKQLERANNQLERASATVGKVVQHEQALEQHRQRQASRSQDRGLSL